MRCILHQTAMSLAIGFAVTLAGCDDVPPPAPQPQAAQPAPQVAPANQPAPAQPDNKGLIGKTTAEVVDLQAALAANPNLKERERGSLGGDPATQATNAYVYMTSTASTFGIQRALQLYQATNDRFPSFPEFQQMMRENQTEFSAVYPWEMYAYDAKTGQIAILVDQAKKDQMYKDAGLEPEQ